MGDDEPPFGLGGAGFGKNRGSSWMAYILPGIEESSLGSKIVFKDGSAFACADAVAKQIIPTFRCSTSPLSVWAPSTLSTSASNVAMVASYVGISGAADTASNDVLPGFVEQRSETLNNVGIISGGGVLCPVSKVKFSDIADGTSKCLLASEQSDYITTSSGVKNEYTSMRWGWMMGAARNGAAARQVPNYGDALFSVTAIRYRINASYAWTGASCTGTGVCGTTPANLPLNSAHGGGVSAAMVDGSVTFLSDATDLSVLAKLATRDDGQAGESN